MLSNLSSGDQLYKTLWNIIYFKLVIENIFMFNNKIIIFT